MAIISVPSYVIPGTYLDNIEFLRDKESVEAIELLFFSFEEESERLLLEELDGIAAARDRFMFSAHMPDMLEDRCETLIEMLRGIAGRFIVHAPATGIDEFEQRIHRWIDLFGNVFAMENVAGRAFDRAALRLADVPLCLDTGHFLLDGKKPEEAFNRWMYRTAEVHLHGIAGGKDHAPLSGNEAWFIDCAPFFERYSGTIHIEIFDYDAIVPMFGVVERFRRETRGR